MREYPPPNEFEIRKIMSDESIDFGCNISNYQWTEWNNVKSLDENDFETLLDHRRLFG